MDREIKQRAGALILFFALVFVGLVVRLVDLQLLQGEALAMQASKQRTRIFVQKGKRGQILDRFGEPLTENLEVASIFAVPPEVEDVSQTASRVAFLLGLEEAEVAARLAQSDKRFVWLRRQVDNELAQRLKMEEIPGIYVTKEEKRSYPRGDLAGQLLGFTGIDMNGLWGVELSFEEYLKGREGRLVTEASPRGVAFPDAVQHFTPGEDGSHVQLSLDPNVQFIAEQAVEKGLKQFGAKRGTAVVLDVQTHEILAMAQAPRFDPNHFDDYPEEDWTNLSTGFAYEPGSTFKVFVVAAALDSGRATARTSFYDPGYLRVGKHLIHDAHGAKHGDVDVSEIIRVSCNVGASQLAFRVGSELVSRYYRRFGFGEKVGIGVPEERGVFHADPQSWPKIRLANLAFGQGILVTPLQLAQGVAAIASGGERFRPVLVQKVLSPAGEVVEVGKPKRLGRVVSSETAAALIRMMEQVVEEGTAKAAKVPGFSVAGKTGTAQKAVGGRYRNLYVASFVGLIPASKPRLVIAVVFDEPPPPAYGGVVAAPVFAEIAKETVKYLGLSPDRPQEIAKLVEEEAEKNEEKGMEMRGRDVAGSTPPKAVSAPKPASAARREPVRQAPERPAVRERPVPEVLATVQDEPESERVPTVSPSPEGALPTKGLVQKP